MQKKAICFSKGGDEFHPSITILNIKKYIAVLWKFVGDFQKFMPTISF